VTALAVTGSPAGRRPRARTLPAFPYARYAGLPGLKGIRVDDPADVAAAGIVRQSLRELAAAVGSRAP